MEDQFWIRVFRSKLDLWRVAALVGVLILVLKFFFLRLDKVESTISFLFSVGIRFDRNS